MNEEQKKRFITFIIDFEYTVKDFREYLSTKEKTTSIILKTFIDGLQMQVDDLKQDIDFLNKDELYFDIEKNEKAYITNFIIGIESDIKSILEYISSKQDIQFKVYDPFFNDFICKVRNLKQNVDFLKGELKYTITATKIENKKE